MEMLGIPRRSYSQEIGSPEGVEEVAGADFFFTMVLPQVKEVKHISVPGLEVDGKSTRGVCYHPDLRSVRWRRKL
jgi:hypothetical protein